MSENDSIPQNNNTKIRKKIEISQAINEHEMTTRHWGLWLLAGAGFALDGFDLFIIGIAMPIIIQEWTWLNSAPWIVGLTGAAAPLGAIIGASLLGRVTDKFGRKYVMVLDMIIFVIFSILCAFAWSIWALFIFRFIAGIAIGGEYPVNAAYIAELIPKKHRKRMQVGNFSFQAIGLVIGGIFGIIILSLFPHLWTWRLMVGIPAVFAIILFFFRLYMPESPKWLASQGKAKEASKTLSEITHDKIKIIGHQHRDGKFSDLFKPEFLKLTILSSVPWVLMDIAFYGVGIFTPLILDKLFTSKSSTLIEQNIMAAKSALFVDLFLIIGIIIAIVLIKKKGMLSLSINGFYGMGIGMLILMSSVYMAGTDFYYPLIFGGFMIFYLCVNAGPNPMTFIIPARVFPTHLRATGQGNAAAAAKIGAAIGIIILPVMKSSMGISGMALFMACICFAGALTTQLFSYLVVRDKQLHKYKKIIEDLRGSKKQSSTN